MFSIMELRLIRHAVKRTMEELVKHKETIDPESEEAAEIPNDLMQYQIIIEKINDRKDV